MFNQINVDQALAYASPNSIERVLVVGSGEGADIVALRNRLGPDPLIVGVDINTHPATFPDLPNTLIVEADITSSSIFGSCFDLVYSFATFEHIHDLQSGWQAMINVLRPGGLLWSVASPLWFSPFGHHKPMFNAYPWIHIMYPTTQSLMEFCADNDIVADDDISMIHHVNYIFNPSCFNRHPTDAYRDAAAGLENAFLEKNDFDYIEGKDFGATIARLEADGHKRENLFAQTHRLIARRI